MIKTPLNKAAIARIKANAKANAKANLKANPVSVTKPRTDVKTRAVVDKALELERILGPVVAAGLLQTQHVPFSVAERVIMHPEQRRKH